MVIDALSTMAAANAPLHRLNGDIYVIFTCFLLKNYSQLSNRRHRPISKQSDSDDADHLVSLNCVKVNLDL